MHARRMVALLILSITAGCSASPTTPAANRLDPASHPLLADITAPGHDILIDSVGSPPSQLQPKVIHGSGLVIEIIEDKTFRRQSYTWSEADPDVTIDYSHASAGVLEITQFTTDARAQRGEVPFIQRTITCTASGPVTEKDRVLLRPEPGDTARINALTRQAVDSLKLEDKNLGDAAFDEPLAHLRNIGIAHPAAVLDAFAQIARHASGAAGESLAGYRQEIELVSKTER